MLYILSSVVLVVVVHDVFLSDSARAKLSLPNLTGMEKVFALLFAGVCFSAVLYIVYFIAKLIIKIAF